MQCCSTTRTQHGVISHTQDQDSNMDGCTAEDARLGRSHSSSSSSSMWCTCSVTSLQLRGCPTLPPCQHLSCAVTGTCHHHAPAAPGGPLAHADSLHALGTAFLLQDSDAPVAVAAAWQAAVPSLIGADGPLLTQVCLQQLQLGRQCWFRQRTGCSQR
jgi:hypothetical protein